MRTECKRIILDCDPGVDDALAIIVALKSKRISLDSITTVNGNVSVKQTTLNALKVLEFMKRPELPVYMGTSEPFIAESVHSKHVFGEDGLGNFSSQMPYPRTKAGTNAVDHILNSIKQGRVDSIVATGPLTNIAQAYEIDKELMNSVKEVIVMGGAVKVPGNITEYSEFNFHCDPHAADYVIRNATNVTLIPLDVTTKTRFFSADIDCIKKPELRNFIRQITIPWFDFSQLRDQNYVSLHDPLALCHVFDKTLLRISRNAISVNCSDFIGRSELSKDSLKRSFWASGLLNDKFAQYFIDLINLD